VPGLLVRVPRRSGSCSRSGCKQHKAAAGLFDDALAGQRGQLAGDHLALGGYAVRQLALQWRRWETMRWPSFPMRGRDRRSSSAHRRCLAVRKAYSLSRWLSVADTASQHFQHGQVDRRDGTAGIAEDGIRHGADPGLLERRDIGRAGLAVNGGHLAEILAGGHVVEDDLAAGCRAQQHSHPSVHHEQDFCAVSSS
jgi:hypothetical protein